MNIIKNTLETAVGPSEWFTGAVYIDTVAAPSDGSRINASSVHFTPGARASLPLGRSADSRRRARIGDLTAEMCVFVTINGV